VTDFRAVVDEYRPPEDLTEFDIWVLWDEREKVPLAPWATGDMYRAGWGDGVVADEESRMEERPETDFETAKMFAEITPAELHQSYAFPRDDEGNPDIPATITPTILLPHYPPDPPIMQVDFDDVRDPETGAISAEVAELIRRFDAFTEVSTSGEGLHIFIRASLPGQLGKFIGDLETEGHIELYDHGRFVGATWKHVRGTPLDVPERQELVNEVVERYEDEDQKRRRTREVEERDVESVVASIRGDKSSGDYNPYYDIDIRDVADRGDFAAYRRSAPGDEWTGPHPGHGPQSSDPDKCTNFGLDVANNTWYCFLDGTGGGPLHLIAVLEGIVSCKGVDELHNDREKLLKACIAARDKYSSGLEDEDPPYKALVGVAEKAGLAMADSSSGKLGRHCWKLSRTVYDNLSAGDV